jgi:hypothetical protein
VTIAIESRADGMLQFLAKGVATPKAALVQFDATVGIDPHNKGLDAVAGGFAFYQLSDEEAVLLED